MSDLSTQRADGVLTLTLEREHARNSLTLELTRDLASAVRGADTDVRCIVIESRGPVFCAGADLEMLSGLGHPDRADDIREYVYSGFQGMVAAIVESPVPVIASVQGPALGAGADLALACDLRVAADSAFLEETWIRLGVVSALGAAATLPAVLGHAGALDMLLTGRRMLAAECLSRGLFQYVVEANSLRPKVVATAATIAAQDPLAVAAFKRLVRSPEDLQRFHSALDSALAEQVALIARNEFAERVDGLLARLHT